MFRHTCRLARCVADAAPEYHYIINNYPDVLRAVLVSNARGFSCASLSAELRRSCYWDCNSDDVDVYLITALVVCRSCRLAGYQTWQVFSSNLEECNSPRRNRELSHSRSPSGCPRRITGLWIGSVTGICMMSLSSSLAAGEH